MSKQQAIPLPWDTGSPKQTAERRIKPPSVPLATLFERVAHDGRHYLVGRIGDARILIVATERLSRGDRVWQAVVTPGPHTPGTAEVDGLDGGGHG